MPSLLPPFFSYRMLLLQVALQLGAQQLAANRRYWRLLALRSPSTPAPTVALLPRGVAADIGTGDKERGWSAGDGCSWHATSRSGGAPSFPTGNNGLGVVAAAALATTERFLSTLAGHPAS